MNDTNPAMMPMFPEDVDSPLHHSHRRFTRVLAKYPARWVWAGFVFVNCFVSIAIMATVAYVSRTVLIFPSLGPTAFLFFYRPLEPVASPRNAVLGHLIGAICGYTALVIFGLQHVQATEITGTVNPARILCAGLALGSTCAIMVLLDLIHPPAASTTLVVALGVVIQPVDLLLLEIAVIALALQGILINRAEGIDFPLWAPRRVS